MVASVSQELITVTPEHAARLLGVGRTTLFELIRRGEVKSILHGRKRLVLVSSLREWVDRQLADAGREKAA